MKQNNFKKAWVALMLMGVLGLQAQTKSTASRASSSSNQPIQLTEANQRNLDQTGFVRCLSVEMDERRRQRDPSIQSPAEFEEWLAPLIQQRRARIAEEKANGTYRRAVVQIPIIFHVITSGSGQTNLSANIIQAQIDQLNIDFANQAGSTHPAAADAEIVFVPAAVDPDGNVLPEIGIDRVTQFGAGPFPTSDFDAGDGGREIKRHTVWDRSLYANIWTANISGGILGYAQFPSNSTLPGMNNNGGSELNDGVVIGSGTVGSVANPGYSAPYNLGRTLTHEVGHWIGLRHIWGDSNCGNDYCDDTPQSQEDNGGCPTNQTTCDGVRDMVENYMDYTNDSCMDIFTADQVERIVTVLENSTGISELPDSPVASANPIIAFQISTINYTEGTDCAFNDIDVPVTIGQAASQNATVTFSAGGSANAADFMILTPSVTFPAGSTADQTLTVRVYGDGFVESDETIVVNMSLNANGGDAELATNGTKTATLTISDDDVAPNSGATVTVFSDGFETYNDFEIGNIGDWTMDDGDGSTHYGDEDVDFANEHYTGTFMVFNPSQTTPVAGANWAPHSGDKGYYCAAATTPTNDDHVITPQMSLNGTGSELRLWMRSLTDEWGADRFNIKISTTNNNVASFTTIQPTSGAAAPYHEAPTAWTEYVYDLSAYDGQDVYVAVHCVSDDSYVLMLDDISVTTYVQNAVQTTVNTATSATMNLAGTGEAYAFDSNDNSIMAKVNNADGFDYGCADISVTRAGTGAQQYVNPSTAEFVMDKVFSIDTDSGNTTGNVTATFYFTEAEISGWEAATGKSRSDLYIFREVNGSVVETVAATVGDYNADKTLTASFTGADGAFYFGPMDTLLAVNNNEFESFSMSPNPAKSNVNIQLSAKQDVNITIYDISGRIVLNQEFNHTGSVFNKTINLDAMTTGLYLVQIESGDSKTTKKLLVK